MMALALTAATMAEARLRQKREEQAPERPVSMDKRDRLVTAPGPFQGRPYWLALVECGGIYFKLNLLYADAAAQAQVVTRDSRINGEFTKKLKQAIGTATTYFEAAENFLMADRGIDRTEAVLIYAGPSDAAGDRVKTIDEGAAAAEACPPLYRQCRAGFPKDCHVPLASKR
jgi:hypothetical protein